MRSVSFWLAIGMLGAVSPAAAAPANPIYIANCLQSSPQITVGANVCTGGTGTVFTVPACGNVPIDWPTVCAGASGCSTYGHGSCQATWYGATLGKENGAPKILDTSTIKRAEQDEVEAQSDDMEVTTPWDANCECDAGGVTWR